MPGKVHHTKTKCLCQQVENTNFLKKNYSQHQQMIILYTKDLQRKETPKIQKTWINRDYF